MTRTGGDTDAPQPQQSHSTYKGPYVCIGTWSGVGILYFSSPRGTRRFSLFFRDRGAVFLEKSVRACSCESSNVMQYERIR